MATEPPMMATTFNTTNMSTGGNPLSKHFRSPALQVKLPSAGRFWPVGSLDQSPTGEYSVFPMTARDEMIFNNPDALLNGQAVVDVIQSCIPAIKNAWAIPSTDIDSILIAIRIASYGETMDFDSNCPACSAENSFGVDLRTFLDRTVDVTVYDTPRSFNGLTFEFRPQDYSTINKLSMETFNTQRLIQIAENEDLEDDDKLARTNVIFKKMTDFTVGVITNGIISITTAEGQKVDNPQYIDEFMRNCDRKTFDFIQKSIEEIGKILSSNDVDAKCSDCGHQYNIPFTFDNANFFASGS